MTVPAQVRTAEDDDVCAGCRIWNSTVAKYTTRRGQDVWLCSSHAFRAWLDGIIAERVPLRRAPELPLALEDNE